MKRAFPAGLSGTTAGWLFGSPARAAVAAFSYPALGSPSGSPPPALSQRETVMRGDICVLGCCLSRSAPRPRPASTRPPARPLANSQTSGPLPCILFLASPLDEGKLFESKAFKKKQAALARRAGSSSSSAAVRWREKKRLSRGRF